VRKARPTGESRELRKRGNEGCRSYRMVCSWIVFAEV
jgi:hypothetical protein